MYSVNNIVFIFKCNIIIFSDKPLISLSVNMQRQSRDFYISYVLLKVKEKKEDIIV